MYYEPVLIPTEEGPANRVPLILRGVYRLRKVPYPPRSRPPYTLGWGCGHKALGPST